MNEKNKWWEKTPPTDEEKARLKNLVVEAEAIKSAAGNKWLEVFDLALKQGNQSTMIEALAEAMKILGLTHPEVMRRNDLML